MGDKGRPGRALQQGVQKAAAIRAEGAKRLDQSNTFDDLAGYVLVPRNLGAGVYAFTAWLVTAPLVAALLYLPLVPAFTRTAGRLRRASAATAGA